MVTLPLDDKDMERLKEIFVTRKECDEEMDAVDKKLANDDKQLAVINTKLGLITWLLAAIGGGVITTLLKLFLGG